VVLHTNLFSSFNVDVDPLQHQVQTLPVAKGKVNGLDRSLLRPRSRWRSLLLPPISLQKNYPGGHKFLKYGITLDFKISSKKIKKIVSD